MTTQIELIDFLRNNTHMARLNVGEVRSVLERIEAEGYVIEKRSGVLNIGGSAEAVSLTAADLPPLPPAPPASDD